MRIKKEYAKDNLTVIWQPDLCIHSGVCFRSLPEVFNPLARPWVKMEGATGERIRATVQACPSGALSLKEQAPQPEVTLSAAAQVNVLPNGPVRVTGMCVVALPDGTRVEKPNGVSFCRCGGSANKPFCDGSHKSNGYVG